MVNFLGAIILAYVCVCIESSLLASFLRVREKSSLALFSRFCMYA